MTSTPPPAAQPLTPENERLYATLIHAGGILIYFVAPLIGYLAFKDRSAFVAENSRNALNFQILVGIAFVAGIVLSIVVIGVLVIIAAAVVNVVFSVLAAIAANRGETYRYPLTINFIK